ncbi:MAG: hypothetical protein ABIJ96_03475 [Elusimicrobiota bacterium]
MDLKGKKEEERRRGAPPIPLLGGQASSGGLYMGVARVGARGPWAKLSALLSTQPAIVATLTAAFVVSAVGLKDMNDRREAGDPYLFYNSAANVAPKTSDSPGVLPGSEEAPSGLALAQQANAGAMGDGLAASGEGVEGEDGEAGEGEEGEEGVEDGALGSAEALKAAADEAGEGDKADAAAKAKEEARAKFSQRLSASRVGATRMGGGSGMSAGIGRGFDQVAEKRGKSEAFTGSRQASTSRGKTAAGSRGKTSLRGATAKRLSSMNKAMKGAQGMGPASESAVHKGQWDAAGAGGQSIGGAGATGQAGGGPTTGTGGAGMQDGGPLTPAGGDKTDGAEDVKKVGPAKNVTPWQKEMDLVMILLPIAGILLLIANLVKKAHLMIAKVIAGIAGLLAATVTILGVMIMSKGQMLQGGMIAAIGALLTFLSIKVLMSEEPDPAGQVEQQTVEPGKDVDAKLDPKLADDPVPDARTEQIRADTANRTDGMKYQNIDRG